MSSKKTELAGCLCVSVAAIIWGSNGVIVNNVPLNAYAIAFLRVLFASIVLTPLLILARRQEASQAARAWRSMLALGGFLSMGWAFLFQSMKLIAIADAVLLNYMAPVFVALLASLLLREKFEKTTIPALAMCMIGMLIISYDYGLQTVGLNMLGVIYGLLAGLAYAGFIILSKKTLANCSSLAVASYSYLASALFLSPSLSCFNTSLNLFSWVLLFILGVFNTAFAVTLYLKGLRLINAQKAVVFTYMEPVSAAIFGFLALGQQLTLQTLIGGLMIVSAGYLVGSK
ncbi:MAG: EamA family transporter [Candidatus Brockarchaeota archaeon]|nr:EamA family transporter [Candidatus Brockarchaeota archaeon]